MSGGNNEKSKGKGKETAKSYNVVGTSSREVDSNIIVDTNSKDDEEEEILYSAKTEVPIVVVCPRYQLS